MCDIGVTSIARVGASRGDENDLLVSVHGRRLVRLGCAGGVLCSLVFGCLVQWQCVESDLESENARGFYVPHPLRVGITPSRPWLGAQLCVQPPPPPPCSEVS